MSLVAQRFGCVEFQISNIFLGFSQADAVEKIKTIIPFFRNSTFDMSELMCCQGHKATLMQFYDSRPPVL